MPEAKSMFSILRVAYDHHLKCSFIGRWPALFLQRSLLQERKTDL